MPMEIRRSTVLSRRRLLRRGAAVLGAALSAAGTAAAGAKVSQAQARYQNTPRAGQRCDQCLQFQPPAACKIVEGAVSPTGSCNFFAPRPRAG